MKKGGSLLTPVALWGVLLKTKLTLQISPNWTTQPTSASDSYVKSQALALDLLAADSLGVVYPSVRHAGGTCVACFRPAAVSNVRFGPSYRFVWSGKSTPTITKESQ